MPAEDVLLAPRRGVLDLERAVAGARDEPASVGREQDGVHGPRVPGRREDLSRDERAVSLLEREDEGTVSGHDIGELERDLWPRHGERAPVPRERHDAARAGGDRGALDAGPGVEDVNARRAARRDPLPRGVERDRDDLSVAEGERALLAEREVVRDAEHADRAVLVHQGEGGAAHGERPPRPVPGCHGDASALRPGLEREDGDRVALGAREEAPGGVAGQRGHTRARDGRRCQDASLRVADRLAEDEPLAVRVQRERVSALER